MINDQEGIRRALQDFREARRQAALQEVMSRFTGKSDKLLSFDEVSYKLKAGSGVDKGLQEIPLKAIIGSCGRYEDFTRNFLPRYGSDKERWVRVQQYVTATGLAGIAPILVYQIGQAYFVLDGNHRVSVARSFGATHIRAHVTEMPTKVSLSPDDQPDDLIVKAEYADFLERTNLAVSRPQADLRVTVPGKYWILDAQIEAHRFLVPGQHQSQASYQEAALYWYDGVYQGVVQIVRERGLLRDFPHRTETDLYLWIFEYRAELKQKLAWDITPHEVLASLAVQSRPKSLMAKHLARRRLEIATSSPRIKSRAITGQWRREKRLIPEQSRLFFNILVAIMGQATGWQALDQAIEIARRERGKVWGFHLVASETDIGSPESQALRDEFDQRCQASHIAGSLTIEAGQAVDQICQRAGLADLVVAPLLNPPGSRLMGRLSSEFRALVQRCARPILAVPAKPSSFTQTLLAYDGSPKAKEALYVATYLSGRWRVPLVVLTVTEANSNIEILKAEAKLYLEQHNVPASYVRQSGAVGEAILTTSKDYGCDLIIMGGYGHSKMKDLVLGSSVDLVLRESKQAMLICR
jgi:nucleotide-binding universal stress UspA family protein